MRVAAPAGGVLPLGAAHKISEQVAHVGLDLLRVFARFQAFDGDIEFLGMTPAGSISFILRIMCAMCLGLFSSKWSMSRSSSLMARITRGSSMSGIGGPPSSFSPGVAAAGSFNPFDMAKRLICFTSCLLPHFGQTGEWSGLMRLDRKLKIFRHFGQANS